MKRCKFKERCGKLGGESVGFDMNEKINSLAFNWGKWEE